jgi:hypothetical protein
VAVRLGKSKKKGKVKGKDVLKSSKKYLRREFGPVRKSRMGIIIQ